MDKKFKRRRLLVDVGFQIHLMVRMGCYFLFYGLFVWHVGFLIHLMQDFANNGIEDGVGELYYGYFIEQKALLFAMAITLPIFCGDLLRFSHRLAGPLFRVRNVMDDMAEGKKVAEFKPRKKDLMQPLFEAFNRLIRRCNAEVASAETLSSHEMTLGREEAIQATKDVSSTPQEKPSGSKTDENPPSSATPQIRTSAVS